VTGMTMRGGTAMGDVRGRAVICQGTKVLHRTI